MLLTHFIWQMDLKPLSGTNAKNGAITPSLTPTMHIIHARCRQIRNIWIKDPTLFDGLGPCFER